MKDGKIKITEKAVGADNKVQALSKPLGEKMDFISLTAHQLREPLSSIKLSLEMLLKGDFGKISKKQKDIIEKILQLDKVLIFLVKDLLDLSRIEEKSYSVNLALVDIQHLIEFVIDFKKEEIKKKNIKLAFQKPSVRLPEIMLDKEKMYLAIQNIVDNAVKYTPKGGRITICLNINNQDLEFSIQDSGIGIPENQKEKLFTKFCRGSNAIKMDVVGSGLGLFITKNAIEAHHGRIWFESKEGEGSTFFFTIPVKGGDPAPIKH